MRNFLYFTLCFFPLILFPQEMYHSKSGTPEYQQRHLTDSKLPRVIISDWMRHTLEYNKAGNKTMELRQFPLGVNNARDTYTYDSLGNKLSFLLEFWEFTYWLSHRKEGYSYGDGSRLLTKLVEIRYDNDWRKDKYTYSYDTSGILISMLKQKWSTDWVNESKENYYYNEAGKLILLISLAWNQDSSFIKYRVLFTYDQRGNLTEKLYQQFISSPSGDIWKNSSRYYYEYNKAGKLNYSLIQSWENEQWTNAFQQIYIYDTAGNIKEYQEDQWYPTWQTQVHVIYDYDYEGNPVHGSETSGVAMINTMPIFFKNEEIRTLGTEFYVDYNITGVSEEQSPDDLTYSLGQNYPNPFNPNTSINYAIAKDGKVSLIIYDILGNKAAVLVDEYKPGGSYSVSFNGSSLSSGVYFYRLESGQFTQTKKLILLK